VPAAFPHHGCPALRPAPADRSRTQAAAGGQRQARGPLCSQGQCPARGLRSVSAAAGDSRTGRDRASSLGPAALAAVALAVATGVAFSWLNLLLGLAVRDPESAGLAGLSPVIILFFSSSALVPVATMPGWLQAFARANPVTVITGALRALVPWRPHGPARPTPRTLGVSVLLGCCCSQVPCVR
jgi:hypothetical protein